MEVQSIYSPLCFHLCHWIIRRCRAWPAQVHQLGGQDLHAPPGAVEKYGRVPLRGGEAGDCTDRKKPRWTAILKDLIRFKMKVIRKNNELLCFKCKTLGGFFVSWLVVLFCSGKWLIRNSLVVFHCPYSVKYSKIKPQCKKWIEILGKLLIPFEIWWGVLCNTLFWLKGVLEISLYHIALNTIFTGKPVSLDLAERFFLL